MLKPYSIWIIRPYIPEELLQNLPLEPQLKANASGLLIWKIRLSVAGSHDGSMAAESAPILGVGYSWTLWKTGCWAR